MGYSYPYVLLLLFFGICAFLFENTEKEEKKSYITALAISVFVIFFGFRGYIYTDWIGYTEMFRRIEWSDVYTIDLTKDSVREPGFQILCLVVKNLTGSYICLNLVITLIYISLLTRFCRQFEINNISLLLMLFTAMEGTGMILNLLRNCISMGIWLNSLVFIRDRRPLPYFALCLLALTFHLSSIIFFPLYFIHKKTNKWVFLGLFIFFFLFFISKTSIVLSIIQILGLEGVLGAKAEAYTEYFTVERGINPSKTLETFALVSLIMVYYDDILDKFKGRHIFINCLLIYFFMYYFLGEFKTLSERMSLLFVFARWILWIDIIHILIIENNRKLLAGIIFAYCLYMTARNLNEPILEYDNVLFGAKTEAQRRQVFYKIVQDDE